MIIKKDCFFWSKEIGIRDILDGYEKQLKMEEETNNATHLFMEMEGELWNERSGRNYWACSESIMHI